MNNALIEFREIIWVLNYHDSQRDAQHLAGCGDIT